MDELQRRVYDLQLSVIREVTGHDSIEARQWADDAMDEAFEVSPRAYLLRIYLDEILKKAPRSRELIEKVESIKQMIAG